MARQRKVGLDKLKIPLKIFGISVKMGCTWIIRPWFLFWEKFRSDARQATTHVSFKKYQAENERNSILCSRARMIEVCSEASFQPLLQLYLLLPEIARFWESSPKANGIEMLKTKLPDIIGSLGNLQFWAVATSVLSLANSFTNYHVVRKRGALDFTANPLGRILLCFFGLLQIISRMVLLVLFAFWWGPGNFWQMFTCVLIHILIISVLHLVTSKRTNLRINLV